MLHPAVRLPRRSESRRRFPGATWAALLAVVGLLGAMLGDTPSPARAQTPPAGVDPAMVERVVASLSVDERIGQLVMVNFVGNDVSANSDIATLIRDFKVGSVLIQASNGNIVNSGDTATQLSALTNGLQQRAYETTQRGPAGSTYFVPLLIATDNEGDLFPLTNVTNGYTSVPNNMTLGATWSKADAEQTGKIVGRELSAAGVNMLLGPVVDVLDTPRSGGQGDIGIRSFGGNPAWVGQLGRAYVRGVHEGSGGSMLSIAKHFPGHGESDRSTESEVPTVNKSLDQLRLSELAPFAEVDRADPKDPLGTADGMMVSHIRYRNFVPSSTAPFTGPVSIDPNALNTLMQLPEFSDWRQGGLVMADSLGVEALKTWYAQVEGQAEFPNRTVVKDALMAGNDLLPLVEFYPDPAKPGWKDNQLPTIEDSILYMRQQYNDSPDFRRRVDDAVRHVIAAKLKLYPKLQLADVSVDPVKAASAAGQGADAMRRISEDALTLIQPQTVADLRSRLPRGPVSPEKVLIVECWADCYPYRVKSQSSLQDTLLQLYGPSGASRLKPADVSTISFGALASWLTTPDDPANATTARAVGDASWIVFALTEYDPVNYPASGAVKRFLDAPPVDLRNKTLVGIAYNVPYHLDSTQVSKLAAYFAVYSKTQASVETGFRALYGDVTPKGHSPVDISGIFYSVAQAVQPDPQQRIPLTVYGQDPQAVVDTRSLPLVAGPIVDTNGEPVPDGSTVSFALVTDAGVTTTATARTVDGLAAATLGAAGRGRYTATASIADIASPKLAVSIGGAAPPTATPRVATTASSGRRNIIIAVVAAAGLLAAALAGVAALRYRRNRARAGAVPRSSAPVEAVAVAPVAAPSAAGGVALAEPPTGPPPNLEVNLETRRVYVRGQEAKPGLSNEQFRLLAFLFERRGKVVAREELVSHIWPDAYAEGVSEEALDALVRRLRERIVQAGGERSYIATLRGQGFRLDA